ncbi:zinc ribbon domain-containing protein [Microbacterium sp.]|uniref:zinc ribbon domain-containing protein n=1 Tax=Microbacterium sp. TaxID=51671 RepID=UPI0034515F33
MVDRWFRSSRLCSSCGSVRQQMPLDVCTWMCYSCGAPHGRDEKAENLLAAERAVTACAASVRSQRSSPGGQSAMNHGASHRSPPSSREGGHQEGCLPHRARTESKTR